MLKSNRKSEGLALNVVIIAALGLGVLVVLFVIFSSQSGKTVRTLESCDGVAGNCRGTCLSGEVEKSGLKCYKNNQPTNEKCCIKIFEEKV